MERDHGKKSLEEVEWRNDELPGKMVLSKTLLWMRKICENMCSTKSIKDSDTHTNKSCYVQC